MSHEDFDKMMHKYVPSQSLRNIQDKLDSLRKKVKCYTLSLRDYAKMGNWHVPMLESSNFHSLLENIGDWCHQSDMVTGDLCIGELGVDEIGWSLQFYYG